MRRSNRYLEAFKESFNVVGLTTAVALSAAMLNPLPLLAGLVAEAAYLLFVADSGWYAKRLSRRYDAEVEKRRQQIKEQALPTLRPSMQARFARLEEMRDQINAQPVEGQTWFREVLRKLDYLLEKFLQFASKDAQFRAYLQSLLEEVRDGLPRRGSEPDFDLGRAGDRSGITRPQRSRDRRSPEAAPLRPEPLAVDREERWVTNTVGEVQAHYEAAMDEIRCLME